MSRIDSPVYHFGDFRLDSAARELRRNGEILELPRLVFGALLVLVRHRDRAVSRDELIKAVWGRPHVEDILVTQIIMRLRRLIGDDSHRPVYIRTVPGFGYHWIAETTEDVAPPSMRHGNTPATGWFTRWRTPVLAALLCLILAVVLIAVVWLPREPGRPLPRAPGAVVVVLPLDVMTSDEADAGWIRLGAMDLIADRLRDAGLPVPPSDSVVSAVHAAAALPEPEREQALRQTLGAGVLIQGMAVSDSGHWTVELTASTADGDHRRVVSGPAEIMPTARRAADQLLAALGRPARVLDGVNEPLSELLQRARAAILTLELDTARAILASAPAALRDEPELLHDLAWVELLAGETAVAADIVERIIDHPDVVAQPRLHAKVWIIMGNIAMREHGDWGIGAPYFDTAIEALAEHPWTPELATALALRGGSHSARHAFDAAAQDLGRARAIFDIIGDRLGVARIHNYFGNLELARKRPADALPHLVTSLERYESFGHINGQRANLYALSRAYSMLLRWPEGVVAGERLWSLRERVPDPGLRDAVTMIYPAMLVSMGRQREADLVLGAFQHRDIERVAFMDLRHEAAARAKLAWQRGLPEQVLQIVAGVLQVWPESGSPLARYPAAAADLTLLHQRAAIAAGRPVPALGLLPGVDDIDREPAQLVARAEWAAFRGDHEGAEQGFRSALVRAERHNIPATLVVVADAYADWLLSRDRISEALALAGRVVDWAELDYTAALLQVKVLHASGREEAWALALVRAQALTGDREIPPGLRQPPL